MSECSRRLLEHAFSKYSIDHRYFEHPSSYSLINLNFSDSSVCSPNHDPQSSFYLFSFPSAMPQTASFDYCYPAESLGCFCNSQPKWWWGSCPSSEEEDTRTNNLSQTHFNPQLSWVWPECRAPQIPNESIIFPLMWFLFYAFGYGHWWWTRGWSGCTWCSPSAYSQSEHQLATGQPNLLKQVHWEPGLTYPCSSTPGFCLPGARVGRKEVGVYCWPWSWCLLLTWAVS